jgi:hypothetical protein
MDKNTYNIRLQELITKVQLLKNDIERSGDKEQIGYLRLAIDSVHEEIRQLMEKNK